MEGGVSLVLNLNVFNHHEALKAKGYTISGATFSLNASPESASVRPFHNSREILHEIVLEGARRML